MSTVKVRFLPYNRTVEVERGENLLEAAVIAGIRISSACGGEGVCGKCKVIARGRRVLNERLGVLTPDEIARGYVLACETIVTCDVEVEVPPESRVDDAEVLLAARSVRGIKFTAGAEEIEVRQGEELRCFEFEPLSTKVFLRLPPPTLQDNVSDLERIFRELKRVRGITSVQTGLKNIRRLGKLLRESNWEVTLTVGQRDGTMELISIEPGDTSHRNFGVAVDVGTTTVAASLVDLVSGRSVGTKGTLNNQVVYGEDVITRIIFASEEEGLERLHVAVVENINSLIDALVRDAAGMSALDITSIVCAGNTTMTQLLLNVDPTYIRKEPYVATANFIPVIRAAEVGIRVNPRAILTCLPSISSYVGGDIAAGTLASGLADQSAVQILIDAGTNGEIVLGNKDWLVCCACSVGPAFEGAGIRHGMRASKGAIQSVRILPGGEVECTTIGGVRPRGICGSGLIDILAELFAAGIIDRSGTIIGDRGSTRVREGTEGLEFVVSWKNQNQIESDIVITQADIRHLMRSKAAIFSGVLTLLGKMNLRLDDVHKFYIAGGFGNYLNIERAITIGLLPDIPFDKFEYIGNSSLAGARMALLSRKAHDRVKEIADKMTYVELSTDAQYMDEFMSSLFLPHTNLALFPNVELRLAEFCGTGMKR